MKGSVAVEIKSSVSGSDAKACGDAKHANLQGKELAIFRTRVCEQHRNGECFDADRCPHSHCQTWQRRNPTDYSYSSKLCPDIEFVKKGKKMTLVRRCGRGRGCAFAHSKEEELYHPTMYKTKLCNAHPHCTRYFCPFAHSVEELRSHARELNNPVRGTAQYGISRAGSVRAAPQCPGSPMSASTAASTSTLPSPTLGALDAPSRRRLNGHAEGDNRESKLGSLGYALDKPYTSGSGSWRRPGPGAEQRQQPAVCVAPNENNMGGLSSGNVQMTHEDAQLWTDILMGVLQSDNMADEQRAWFEQCNIAAPDSAYPSLIDSYMTSHHSGSRVGSYDQSNASSNRHLGSCHRHDRGIGLRANSSMQRGLIGGQPATTPGYPQRTRGGSLFLPTDAGYGSWPSAPEAPDELEISRRRLSSGMNPFYLSRLSSHTLTYDSVPEEISIAEGAQAASGCASLRQAAMHNVIEEWLADHPVPSEENPLHFLRQQQDQNAALSSIEALRYGGSRCSSNGRPHPPASSFSGQWSANSSGGSVSNAGVTDNDFALLNALSLFNNALPHSCDERVDQYSSNLGQRQSAPTDGATATLIAKMLSHISDTGCPTRAQEVGVDTANQVHSAQTTEPHGYGSVPCPRSGDGVGAGGTTASGGAG